jgi:hypothetical protein
MQRSGRSGRGNASTSVGGSHTLNNSQFNLTMMCRFMLSMRLIEISFSFSLLRLSTSAASLVHKLQHSFHVLLPPICGVQFDCGLSFRQYM